MALNSFQYFSSFTTGEVKDSIRDAIVDLGLTVLKKVLKKVLKMIGSLVGGCVYSLYTDKKGFQFCREP